jgi:hypothetical protein
MSFSLRTILKFDYVAELPNEFVKTQIIKLFSVDVGWRSRIWFSKNSSTDVDDSSLRIKLLRIPCLSTVKFTGLQVP